MLFRVGGQRVSYQHRQVLVFAALMLVLGLLIVLFDSPVSPRVSAAVGTGLGISAVSANTEVCGLL